MVRFCFRFFSLEVFLGLSPMLSMMDFPTMIITYFILISFLIYVFTLIIGILYIYIILSLACKDLPRGCLICFKKSCDACSLSDGLSTKYMLK